MPVEETNEEPQDTTQVDEVQVIADIQHQDLSETPEWPTSKPIDVHSQNVSKHLSKYFQLTPMATMQDQNEPSTLLNGTEAPTGPAVQVNTTLPGRKVNLTLS